MRLLSQTKGKGEGSRGEGKKRRGENWKEGCVQPDVGVGERESGRHPSCLILAAPDFSSEFQVLLECKAENKLPKAMGSVPLSKYFLGDTDASLWF